MAQLVQGDAELACHTAGRVIPPAGSPDTARVYDALACFTTTLNRMAPAAAVTRTCNEATA